MRRLSQFKKTRREIQDYIVHPQGNPDPMESSELPQSFAIGRMSGEKKPEAAKKSVTTGAVMTYCCAVITEQG